MPDHDQGNPRRDWRKGTPTRSGGQRPGPTRAAHGWQKAGQRNATGSARQWFTHWGPYALGGALLLAVFVALLLYRPIPTPVLYVTAVDYESPAVLNAWAAEDRQNLGELDRVTLAVTDVEGEWGESADAKGRANLAKVLASQRSWRGFRPVSEPVVVYFSMHGAVDEAGKPCLVPPGASVLESSEWVRVEKLLDTVTESTPDRAKLVVFDSQRAGADWRCGVVYDSFVERVEQLIDAKSEKYARIAVLTAAGPGETSLAGPELRGSLFGRFFQLGIAGAADEGADNEDGYVSLRELVAYLQREAPAYAWAAHDARQTPRLIVADEVIDFRVAKAVRGGTLSDLVDALHAGGGATPALDPSDIDGLWRRLDRLRLLDVVRFDPVALGKFENDLLRLEEMAYGGSAYKKSAGALLGELKKSLPEEVATPSDKSEALADWWGVANSRHAASFRVEPPPASPLRSYLGAAGPGGADQVAQDLERLWQSLVSQGSEAGAQPFDRETLREASRHGETQLLVAAQRWGVVARPKLLGAALDLHRLGERVATPLADEAERGPGDERAHYLARPDVADADNLRRRFEDSLFAGGATNEIIGPLRDGARRGYERATEVYRDVARAFSVGDRCAAEGPYLFRWAERAAIAPSSKPEALTELVGTIKAARKLTTGVARLGNVRSDTAEKGLAALRQRFDRACAFKELDAARGARELAAAEAALRTPLLGWEQRKELRKLGTDLAIELHAQRFKAESALAGQEQAEERPPTDDPSIADRMARWNERPLPLLLGAEPRAGSSAPEGALQTLEAESWRARRRLAEIGRTPEDRPDGARSVKEDRDLLADDADDARWGAPLAAARADDAVGVLRRFDVQQLLLWRARRALDDFWATTVGRDDPASIGELLRRDDSSSFDVREPWFAAAAADFLRAARQVNDSPSDSVASQFADLEKSIEERKHAARDGVGVSAVSRAVLAAPDRVEVQVTVEAPRAPADLPPGEAAVLVLDGGKSVAGGGSSGPDWGGVAIPVGANGPQSKKEQIAGVSGGELDAVVLYRGHTFSRRFEATTMSGALVEYEPPVQPNPSILVEGNQARPPSVVFILDCSWSMNAPGATEGGVPRSRLREATAKLDEMLGELQRRGVGALASARPRVGVVFFGHRVGWNLTTGQLNKNAAATKNGEVPDHLHPGNDVETVLTLGYFGAQELGLTKARLKPLKPLGVTPVNLSIIEALGEFGDLDDETSMSILVVTDGENNQDHDSRSGLQPVTPTTVDDVLNAWNRAGKPVEVHILGYGIPRDESAVAVRDFSRIANHTGGSFIATESGSELIRQLKERLDVSGFTVFDAEGEPITRDADGDSSPVPLNTLVEVRPDERPLPATLKVRFEGAEEANVALEASEALRLRVSQDGRRLEPVPYEPAVASGPMVRAGSDARGSLVGRAHTAVRSAAGAAFRLSVQDTEAPYTPRPAEVWVEVRPEGSPEVYLFYDRVFEPKTPTPVVRFFANNWPDEARRARVRFWCRDTTTDPAQVAPLAEVLRNSPDEQKERAVDGVPGAAARVVVEKANDGEVRVVVTERFQAPATVGSTRIDLAIEPGLPTPYRVSHRFDADSGLARHEYLVRLGTASEGEFARGAEVRVVSAEAFRKGAYVWRPEDGEGALVEVVPDDSVHRTDGGN
ncbi:MAG: hypothetical protein ACRCT8_03860 [Lacipirellulaceae bacterium]